jgi:D-hydroxyproline dehydrogenase subunit beta
MGSRGVDVVVIGGGVIGVAAAHACAENGMSVVLCERHGLAAAASGRNQGLAIGPHTPPLEQLAARSEERWLQLHERSGGTFGLDVESGHYLVVGESDASLDRDAALPRARRLSADDLSTAEPLLAQDLAGGALVPGVRRLDPAAAVATLAGEARRLGAEIRTGCEVKELMIRAGRVSGALTDAGELRAGNVVVAAGPWSARVCRSLAFDVPVRGVGGWIAITRPAPFRLRHVIQESRELWNEMLQALRWTVRDAAAGILPPRHHAALLQQDRTGRVVIGSSLAVAPGDHAQGDEVLREICARAVRLVPELAGLEIAETRTCKRPASPDGLPLHGPVPGVDGLVLASGHGPRGITWGPAAGEAIAAGIATAAWDAAFLPERFASTQELAVR